MAKALVTGSFDPVTLGHLDLIKRASRIFDSVTVGVFVNSTKTYTFTVDERVKMLRAACEEAGLSNVSVEACDGLVAQYVEEHNVDVIVKGARSAADFEYEKNMAEANKMIFRGAETMLFFSDPEYSSVSSSLVRTLIAHGVDVSSMVPKAVAERVNRRKDG